MARLEGTLFSERERFRKTNLEWETKEAKWLQDVGECEDEIFRLRSLLKSARLTAMNDEMVYERTLRSTVHVNALPNGASANKDANTSGASSVATFSLDTPQASPRPPAHRPTARRAPLCPITAPNRTHIDNEARNSLASDTMEVQSVASTRSGPAPPSQPHRGELRTFRNSVSRSRSRTAPTSPVRDSSDNVDDEEDVDDDDGDSDGRRPASHANDDLSSFVTQGAVLRRAISAGSVDSVDSGVSGSSLADTTSLTGSSLHQTLPIIARSTLVSAAVSAATSPTPAAPMTALFTKPPVKAEMPVSASVPASASVVPALPLSTLNLLSQQTPLPSLVTPMVHVPVPSGAATAREPRAKQQQQQQPTHRTNQHHQQSAAATPLSGSLSSRVQSSGTTGLGSLDLLSVRHLNNTAASLGGVSAMMQAARMNGGARMMMPALGQTNAAVVAATAAGTAVGGRRR